MKTAKSRAVRGKQLSQLLAEAIDDRELQAFFESGDRAYSLPDGRALSVLRDGSARVWSSRNEALQMFRELRDGPQITHVLQRYAFTGEFPAEVDAWIEKLADRIKVDRNVLMPASAGVQSIQLSIPEKGVGRLMKPGAFEGVVALVGKALIGARGGNWEMIEEEDCNVWEPTVRLADGTVESVGVDLYDELKENGRHAVLSY